MEENQWDHRPTSSKTGPTAPRAVRRIGCPSGPVSVPGLTEFPTRNLPFKGMVAPSQWHYGTMAILKKVDGIGGIPHQNMDMEFSRLIGSVSTTFPALSQLDCASQWISDLLQQWPRIQHFMVSTSWYSCVSSNGVKPGQNSHSGTLCTTHFS